MEVLLTTCIANLDILGFWSLVESRGCIRSVDRSFFYSALFLCDGFVS